MIRHTSILSLFITQESETFDVTRLGSRRRTFRLGVAHGAILVEALVARRTLDRLTSMMQTMIWHVHPVDRGAYHAALAHIEMTSPYARGRNRVTMRFRITSQVACNRRHRSLVRLPIPAPRAAQPVDTTRAEHEAEQAGNERGRFVLEAGDTREEELSPLLRSQAQPITDRQEA